MPDTVTFIETMTLIDYLEFAYGVGYNENIAYGGTVYGRIDLRRNKIWL